MDHLIISINGWPSINVKAIASAEEKAFALGFIEGQRRLCYCVDETQVPANYLRDLEKDADAVKAKAISA